MLPIGLLLIAFTAGVRPVRTFGNPESISISPESLSLIISSTTKSPNKDEDKRANDIDELEPRIYEMNVFANVSNRFATNIITSKVKNYGKQAREATFSVVLPDSAYITGFIMEMNGKNYTAYVKEKEQARQEYDRAIADGFGAAHVAASARDSNRFTISVNVEASTKASFYLTYEELLKRKQGKYDLVINIHPKQPVSNLNVEVFINETRPLKFVKTAPIRTGNDINDAEGDRDPRAIIINIDANSARVKFNPDIERQKELAKILGTKEDDGLSGQFIVQYEVERDTDGGEVLVKDGYFVHFFAPSNIQPLPKHIVFVLDTNGSMYGQRIIQLKTAMKSILSELHEQDLFNIISFHNDVNVWNVDNYSRHRITKYRLRNKDKNIPSALVASADNLKKANTVIDKFRASGGTNIFDALVIAIQLVEKEESNIGEERRQPIIMFLTDGEPTVGITNTEEIISNVSELNAHIPIFSLSFGDGADKNFLQKLSLQNNAFSRHIYEAADASLQLQSFYKQISSPLLSNVTFKYTQEAEKLTKTHFPNYFGGGEIVLCGYSPSGKFSSEQLPSVSAWGVGGPRHFTPKVKEPVGELERLWAYYTIQQLLDNKEVAKNKPDIEKKALDLALKYSFVTLLTSLIVVRPNDTRSVDTETAECKPVNQVFSSTTMPNRSFARTSNRKMTSSFNIGNRMRYTPNRLFNKYNKFTSHLDHVRIISGSTSSDYTVTELLTALPWLSNIYNNKYGTIILPTGTYELGINATMPSVQACTNTPQNENGTCLFLQDCEKIHSSLTSLLVYNQYFCSVQRYAGVCCPL